MTKKVKSTSRPSLDLGWGQQSTGPTYQLVDSGDFKRLEHIGGFLIERPAPAAVWSPSLAMETWKGAQARFERLSEGNGRWHFSGPDLKGKSFEVRLGSIPFVLRMTGFGHLGLFAEQEPNWRRLQEVLKQPSFSSSAPAEVLNLFAYTGGSTMACALAGARVTHVDASKTSVDWARENAARAGLAEAPIRWIVEDVQAFVARELRRGRRYQGLILDPPSFGRGPKGQTWKIEEHLIPLLRDLAQLMDPERGFVLLSSHSPGYTPTALGNLLAQNFGGAGAASQGQIQWAEEMLIHDQQGQALPSGASAWWL